MRTRFGFSTPALGRFLLDPAESDMVGGGAPAPEAAPVASDAGRPEWGQETQVTEPAAAVAEGAGGVDATPRVPADPNQAAATSWRSLRDVARERGYNFDPSITDDAGALNHLLTQAARGQQEDFYAKLGRQIAPQAQAFQQFVQQQQAPKAPEAPKPWQAPEFNPQWAGLVDRDPGTGVFIPKPGIPQEIATKVNSYVDWKERFDRDPASVINGLVEERAAAIASRTFKEQFEQHQREAEVQRIHSENSSWLYQADETGRAITDFQGRPQFTPNGVLYVQAVRQLQAAGVTNPVYQDAYAKQAVQNQYLLARYQQEQAATARAASPQAQAALGRPNVGVNPALTHQERAVSPAGGEANLPAGTSLAEMLRAELRAGGVTDDDIKRAAENMSN